MYVGQILKNGAMLLAWKEEKDTVVILALNKKNEFVIWLLDPNGETCSGRYHSDLLTAVENFKLRS
jgi:hypothetical protein